MRLGLTLGINNSNFVSSVILPSFLIADFKLRVAADSGIYEAESCQLSILNNLNI